MLIKIIGRVSQVVSYISRPLGLSAVRREAQAFGIAEERLAIAVKQGVNWIFHGQLAVEYLGLFFSRPFLQIRHLRGQGAVSRECLNIRCGQMAGRSFSVKFPPDDYRIAVKV